MAMLQLDPPIEVDTPKGKGYAEVIIDYGLESDVHFMCLINNGEIWVYPAKDIRTTKNISVGRTL
jgi:hypothetical protein